MRKYLSSIGATGMLVCLFVASAPPANAQVLIARPSDLTGTWYDPNTSGQGFVFDVYGNYDGTASIFGGWFTFSQPDILQGTYPVWFTLQGQISSFASPAPLDIYITRGGQFDAPPVVRAGPAGNGTIQFSDCYHAVFTYAVPGIFLDSPSDPPPIQSGSIALVRLSADVGCNQQVTPPKSSRAFSGTWYNPTTSGQGILFDVSKSGGGFFFGGWFTYGEFGVQAWYTLQGPFPTDATEADLPVYVGKDESFGSSSVPPGGSQAIRQVGTAHIKFTGCNDAQLDYAMAIRGTAGIGSIPLKRLTPTPADCPL